MSADPWLVLLIGGLYSCAFYMMLRRSLTKTLFGLVLLSNAANLLIFVAAGVTIGRPALVPDGLQAPEGLVADPLAQAFILTAIVIGFGVLAFAVVLIRRAHEVLDVDDFDELKDAEQ
ncbi:MAG: cation:proton antiporter [Polycyclovorans sp.]|jgi:multicomponent Na+:H+ antiporter subunit C|nr:cation:proton antiporter [Polycyclovorans sp.]|tara:strand:+ start:81641 stop:81994 length:354 start_codon:yes stop_codon:yes gene_type:complete